MGILSTIKSLLSGEDHGRSSDAGTPVSVEREPAAESERAVKGVDAPPDEGETFGVAGEAPAHDAEETVAHGAGDTATLEDEEPPTHEVDEDAAAADGEPVDAIKGIGTAYAERLADAGVHSVEDLAQADVEALAADTGLGSGRVGTWVERARARTR